MVRLLQPSGENQTFGFLQIHLFWRKVDLWFRIHWWFISFANLIGALLQGLRCQGHGQWASFVSALPDSHPPFRIKPFSIWRCLLYCMWLGEITSRSIVLLLPPRSKSQDLPGQTSPLSDPVVGPGPAQYPEGQRGYESHDQLRRSLNINAVFINAWDW